MILNKKTPDGVLTFKGESMLVQIEQIGGNGITFWIGGKLDETSHPALHVLCEPSAKTLNTEWCVAGTMQPITIVLDCIKGEFSLRVVPFSCDILMEPLDFERVQ